MIRPPSAVKHYDWYYSGDSAFVQLASDATEDQVKEHRARLTAARETGDWTALLVPGGSPTKFVLGQVDRNDWRAVLDRCELPDSNPRAIRHGELAALLFRLAIRSIPGFGEVKITRTADEQWGGWVMAQPEIVTMLDEIDEFIVVEIGAHVLSRLRGIGPKF
jgi:hypothetical protein